MLLKKDEALNNKRSANNQLENQSELERYLKTSGKNKAADSNESNKISKDKNDEKVSSSEGKEKNNRNNSGKSGGKTAGTDSKYKHKSRKIEKVDDDIVARQLREAAEKETDPELKEKLWEEYETYKQKTN